MLDACIEIAAPSIRPDGSIWTASVMFNSILHSGPWHFIVLCSRKDVPLIVILVPVICAVTRTGPSCEMLVLPHERAVLTMHSLLVVI